MREARLMTLFKAVHRSALHVVLGVVLGVALSAASGGLTEANAKGSGRARAVELYQEGVTFYNLSEFDEALKRFREAYRLDPVPSLLFNIAQCHRKMGRPQDALTYYQRYIRDVPPGPTRKDAERHATAMEAQLKELEEGKRPMPRAESPTSAVNKTAVANDATPANSARTTVTAVPMVHEADASRSEPTAVPVESTGLFAILRADGAAGGDDLGVAGALGLAYRFSRHIEIGAAYRFGAQNGIHGGITLLILANTVTPFVNAGGTAFFIDGAAPGLFGGLGVRYEPMSRLSFSLAGSYERYFDLPSAYSDNYWVLALGTQVRLF